MLSATGIALFQGYYSTKLALLVLPAVLAYEAPKRETPAETSRIARACSAGVASNRDNVFERIFPRLHEYWLIERGRPSPRFTTPASRDLKEAKVPLDRLA